MPKSALAAAAVAGALFAAPTAAAPLDDSCHESVSLGFETGSAELDFVANELLDYARDTAIDERGQTRARVRIVTHIDGAERARGLTSLDEARGEAIRRALRAMPDTGRWTYQIEGMDDRSRRVPEAGAEPLNRRAVIFFCSA